MRYFFSTFGVSYLTVLLAATGSFHLLRLRHFAAEVAAHGIFPRDFARPAAALAPVAELALALGLGVSWFRPSWTLALLILTALLGGAYLLYLRALWRRPGGSASCGCSPFRAPLSRASFYPGATLILVSAIAILNHPSVTGPVAGLFPVFGIFALAIPMGWAGVLATLILLFPATVPSRSLAA